MTRSRAKARAVEDLSWEFTVEVDGGGTIRPMVSGQDILAEHRNSRGRDPDDLLPPLSDLLLPVRSGRHVVIGSCTCGDTGCGSLSMMVRRDGGIVRWEPFDTGHRETVHRAYSFDLVQYLEAVDAAAEERPGEGRARRVARLVLRRLLLYDEVFDGAGRARPRGIERISSWPWDSDVVNVLGGDLHEPLLLPPLPDESDQQYADRLFVVINDMR